MLVYREFVCFQFQFLFVFIFIIFFSLFLIWRCVLWLFQKRGKVLNIFQTNWPRNSLYEMTLFCNCSIEITCAYGYTIKFPDEMVMTITVSDPHFWPLYSYSSKKIPSAKSVLRFSGHYLISLSHTWLSYQPLKWTFDHLYWWAGIFS